MCCVCRHQTPIAQSLHRYDNEFRRCYHLELSGPSYSFGMDTASDFIRQVIGPSFDKSFDVFLPSVMRYAKGSRPASDRAMAVGCLAEVFECIGG